MCTCVRAGASVFAITGLISEYSETQNVRKIFFLMGQNNLLCAEQVFYIVRYEYDACVSCGVGSVQLSSVP